jgi:hypothetical protein
MLTLSAISTILSNLNREFALVNEVHFAIRFFVLLHNFIFRVCVRHFDALNNSIVHLHKVFRSSFLHHFSVSCGHMTSLLHVMEFSLRTPLTDLPHDAEEGAIV